MNRYLVAGAGELILQTDGIAATGSEVGVGVAVTWGDHGMAGGVLDVQQVRQIVKDLSDWLRKYAPENAGNDDAWRKRSNGRKE